MISNARTSRSSGEKIGASRAAFIDAKLGSTVELVIIGTTCGEIKAKFSDGLATTTEVNSSRKSKYWKLLPMVVLCFTAH